jgi:hypothetical protein
VAHQNTIFNQLFHFIPRHVFSRVVDQLQADRYTKSFTAWQQCLVLLYAQISGKDSLRAIESGLLAHRFRLYHLGLPAVARSTLADALQRRPSALFETLFYALLHRAQAVAPRHKFRFHNPLFSFDSTTIDLCLSVFDWARFRKQKGAIKLHCQLDHRGHLPNFLVMTDGLAHDLTVARHHFQPVPDSIYCFDRAYLGLPWLNELQGCGAFVVTRALKHQSYRVVGQQAQPPSPGILADQIIELEGSVSRRKYPRPLRLVTFRDPASKRLYRFLTNHFHLAASTIAEIYRQRWQIEIFFKWIKQNLEIKTFLGTSRNAVMAQIWVAMLYYLLLSYIKFLSRIPFSITELTRRIQDTLLHRLDLLEVLALTRTPPPNLPPDFDPPQLSLFPT